MLHVAFSAQECLARRAIVQMNMAFLKGVSCHLVCLTGSKYNWLCFSSISMPLLPTVFEGLMAGHLVDLWIW